MAPPEVLLNTYSYLCQGLHQLLMSLGSHDTFIISNLVISKTTVLLLYLIELLLYLLLLNYSQLKSYLLLSAVLLLQLGAIYQKSIRIHAKHLIVFHEHSSSMIGIQRQGVTTLYCSNKIRNPLTVRNYQLWSATSIRYQKLTAAYLIPNHVIFIVGKSGIYPTNYSSNSIVILRQSPKIHLEKLLKTLRPTLVIADGSNYKSYIKRWKKTCRQQKTPFHATAEKGAFVLSF
jgi:competence protein ComEC